MFFVCFCCNLADIDECASSPCQNGGICTNQINAYTCTCMPGFAGINCEVGKFACLCLFVCLFVCTSPPSKMSIKPMLTLVIAYLVKNGSGDVLV